MKKKSKRLEPSILLKIINRAKKKLQTDKAWIEICKEYDEDPSIIQTIPTCFGKLDVSAKTVKGIVILNYKLLNEDDVMTAICQYMIHEFTHAVFQQCMGTKPTKSSDDENYLHNKHEQEAFSNQIAFISDHLGKEEAENYTENLLEYHQVDDKKEKQELEEKLLSKT